MRLFTLVVALLGAASTAARKDVKKAGAPCAMDLQEFRQKAEAVTAKRGHSVKGTGSTQGTIVGAQLNCHGYLCPQWELRISRWDLVPAEEGANQEYPLLDLLPLAPTFQRNQPIFTDYDQASRTYTVAVQSYPGNGVDTFFQAQISDDISGAKMLQNNVIVGHPDATPNNPGSMTLIRAFDSPAPDGGIVAIFSDGSVWNLDLLSKKYTAIGNLKSDASVKGTFVTNAHVFDGSILKSFLVEQNEVQSYFVTLDITTGKTTTPVALLPVEGGGKGQEVPVNAHIIDNGLGTNILAVIMAGQFDQIIQIDETVGTQTPIIFSITQDNEVDPSILYCDKGTKDCDTVWTTSAYDSSTKNLYMQAHYIDQDDVYWTSIYRQYYLNQVAGTFGYFDPVTLMNFGYSGYQFVNVPAGVKKFAKKMEMKSPAATKEKQAAVVKARKEMAKQKKAQLELESGASVDVRSLQSKDPTGLIISAQFYKAAQAATYELRISATNPIQKVGVPNDVNLQTLLPAISQDNQVYTAFCSDKRYFFVAVDNYPRTNFMTIWKSVISAKGDAATPVDVAVEIQYPVSGSPEPLNVITPAIARLVLIPGTGPTVIFQNGETYAIDMDAKAWKPKLFSLISGEDLYSVSHPYATTSQVVDTAANSLHSFIFSGSNVFLANTDLKSLKTDTFVGPLDMPGTQDLSTGFSPETLLSGHMITLDDGSSNLLMTMESLDNTGFDELNFVNTTSGVLSGPVYNLMEYSLVLTCMSYNCDKWRNSVYDPVSNVVYFQAHYDTESTPLTTVLAAMVYVTNHVTGKKYWVVNNMAENLGYGYTGMVWVPFA